MKKVIGVLQYKRFTPYVLNVASEYFGKAIEETAEDETLWVEFSSMTNAKEFASVIGLICVDEDKNVFKGLSSITGVDTETDES